MPCVACCSACCCMFCPYSSTRVLLCTVLLYGQNRTLARCSVSCWCLVLRNTGAVCAAAVPSPSRPKAAPRPRHLPRPAPGPRPGPRPGRSRSRLNKHQITHCPLTPSQVHPYWPKPVSCYVGWVSLCVIAGCARGPRRYGAVSKMSLQAAVTVPPPSPPLLIERRERC